MASKPIYFETQTMSLCCIVGIYLDDGQVCEFINFDSKGKVYGSGDIVELPRKGIQKLSSVVILGIHEDLGPAIVAAKVYFDRVCKWDGVTDRSNLKVFGHDIIALEEEVSQIGLFDTQGMSGPQLLTTNCIDLKDLLYNDDESPQESQE